ncbi:MAG: sulfatase, partial [Pirellulaceae bacterium]|nr:sulfatase [Pirellulaceae bacterium]
HPVRMVLILTLFTALVGATSLLAATRLNVLFITADDLGLQLSCYGNTVISTPHLDRLAERGARFEIAYVAQASCNPSRSAMFTGLYPHANGQYGLMGRTDAPSGFALHEHLQDKTIPSYLKRSGYRTGIIGKLHVAPEDSFPFDFRKRPRIATREVRLVAKTAGEFWQEAGEEPFFLMVNYSDPHASRSANSVGGWTFHDQVDGLPKDPILPGAAPPLPFQGIDTPDQLKRVSGYYNTIKRLDAGIGMLLDELRKAGHAEDTLIIFCGDHGPPFARGKTSVYESGTRVPLTVYWPGVSRRMTSKAMVSTVDILPTILDAVGEPIPEGLHGRSLRPVVSDPKAAWREYLVAEFHFHGTRPFYPRRGIRNRRYHLIHNLLAGSNKPSTRIDGDQAYRLSQTDRFDNTAVRRAFNTFANPPEFELYDTENDPAELNNLGGNRKLAGVEERLKEALLRWRHETDDPLLDPLFVEKLDAHKPPR